MEEQKSETSEQVAVTVPILQANEADAKKNKLMAVGGYIVPLLFFIPLVTSAKNSPFAKFHANQQLNLLLTSIAVNIIGRITLAILPIGVVLVLALTIMGIINGAKGEMKELPIIGGFKLIK